MLNLTRRRGEKIFVGDDIVIVVTQIDRGKVRIGIEAPPDMKIDRDENVPADDPRRRNETEY